MNGETPFDSRNEPHDRRIAVVGIGCRFPGHADSPERFWQVLDTGADVVAPLPQERWERHVFAEATRYTREPADRMAGAFLDDIEGWDPDLFDVSAEEAVRIDPQQRLVMEVAWRAIEDAGIDLSILRSIRTGVFAGVSDSQQYTRLQHQCDPDCVDDPLMAIGSSGSMAGGRLAFFLDAKGPTLTLDTACSTALVAVHLAAESLRRSECDVAVVATASAVVHPESYAAAHRMGMLAPDGRCRTFDRHADGFIVGEGAGAVVLERAEDAVANGRRVRAVVRGSAVGQCGQSNGLTAPNGEAQASVIRTALARSALEPDRVSFVEAHGSGTVLGDAIELEALRDVFGPRAGEHPLHLGAVKTNIGHALASAGMAGFIKTVLALEHRRLPANRNFAQGNPILRRTPWLQPAATAVDLVGAEEPLVGSVSSFAWSGTNAHVVVEEAPQSPAEAGPAPFVLTLSAASPRALVQLSTDLADFLESEQPSLGDVAYTLQVGRSGHRHRRAVVCDDLGDAVEKCRELGFDRGDRERHADPRIGVFFPAPSPSQDPPPIGMLTSVPVVASAVETCRRAFHVEGIDVDDAFDPGRAARVDAVTRAAADFSARYALASALVTAGIAPQAVLGLGAAQDVAACVAGVLLMEDAVRLVAARARLGMDERVATLEQRLPRHDTDATLFTAEAPEGLGDFTSAVDIIVKIAPADTLEGDQPVPGVGSPLLVTLPTHPSQGPSGGRVDLLHAAATLWEYGARLDWRELDGVHGRVITLPPHSFQRVRCWISASGTRGAAVTPEVATPTITEAEPVARAGDDAEPLPVRVEDRDPRPDLRTPFVPARTALQREIAEIWGTYLGIRDIGIDDRLFELGGKSVVVASIAEELERSGLGEITPGLLFQCPTIRELATELESAEDRGEGDGESMGPPDGGSDAPTGGRRSRPRGRNVDKEKIK